MKKLIIVEDSHFIAAHLQYILLNAGYGVLGIATSFKELKQLLLKGVPDLVFMDVVLEGDKDGIECAVELWEGYKIPVVFITSLSDSETLKRINSAHAFGYLSKPFQDRDVLNVLELALYKYDAELALHNSREQFYSVVQAISDPLITINEHFKISYINPAAEALTGYLISEAIGKLFSEVFEVIDPDTRQSVSSPLYCEISQQQSNSVLDHFILVSKRGKHIPVGEGSMSPIISASNTLAGMVIVFKNLILHYEKINQEKLLEKEKKQALHQGIENERHRLARELHDGLGQLLNAIKIKSDTLVLSTEKAKEISELLEVAIDDVGRIADELLPAKLRHLNLDTAIKSLCQSVASVQGIQIDHMGTTESLNLTKDYELSIYRIAQEAIQNAIKHGKSSKIVVQLSKEKNHIVLSIKDDGVGFNMTTINRKNGILNMYERAEIMNGYLHISSAPDNGTEVQLRVSPQ